MTENPRRIFIDVEDGLVVLYHLDTEKGRCRLPMEKDLALRIGSLLVRGATGDLDDDLDVATDPVGNALARLYDKGRGTRP